MQFPECLTIDLTQTTLFTTQVQMSNCEGGNSITMFSKVAGKVYEKWNYFEASCDPVLTFSEQNFVAGQYLADYTKSRVSSEKKKRHGREEEERERDGGISLMPRAVRWPWLNASPNSLGPLIRPIHSGQCARCVCVHVQEPEQAIRCVYTCACRRLCVCVPMILCVPTPILLCKHADLAQHQ